MVAPAPGSAATAAAGAAAAAAAAGVVAANKKESLYRGHKVGCKSDVLYRLPESEGGGPQCKACRQREDRAKKTAAAAAAKDGAA